MAFPCYRTHHRRMRFLCWQRITFLFVFHVCVRVCRSHRIKEITKCFHISVSKRSVRLHSMRFELTSICWLVCVYFTGLNFPREQKKRTNSSKLSGFNLLAQSMASIITIDINLTWPNAYACVTMQKSFFSYLHIQLTIVLLFAPYVYASVMFEMTRRCEILIL